MPHWLAYQLAMPVIYFHAVVVLPNRYEQFGFTGEDYAAYDLPLAALTVVLLLVVSRMANDGAQPLAFFMRAYVVQLVLVAAVTMQYVLWSGRASASFTILYVVLNRLQDLLFFVFEVGEFAFYGRVAMLCPSLVATLVTLQASMFNFADFFHSWLAPALVDGFSRCSSADGHFACARDAYPPVALLLTALGCVYLATQWRRIHSYQDVKDAGWQPQPPLKRNEISVFLMLAGMLAFTAQQSPSEAPPLDARSRCSIAGRRVGGSEPPVQALGA
eukprot:CAMPEP_0204582736 /NCGR_PEP_ID=MMETSP0661-20131031/45384_1 /ASSEMBLY_ACC=CAM_ASM_000606 /TAXON_ID=109239 /ORGANISM="Alexandrium margalefi, Strain AMGDE01CS-322" /LENGTH=273 /DNA_ID=CAMNT_0051592037 /DNA_START=26 /DNA_END=845 /DNA_ORIENTATION=-